MLFPPSLKLILLFFSFSTFRAVKYNNSYIRHAQKKASRCEMHNYLSLPSLSLIFEVIYGRGIRQIFLFYSEKFLQKHFLNIAD